MEYLKKMFWKNFGEIGFFYYPYNMKKRDTKAWNKKVRRERIRTAKHGNRTKSTKPKKVGDIVRLFNKRDELGFVHESYDDYIIVEWYNSMEKTRHRHSDVFLD